MTDDITRKSMDIGEPVALSPRKDGEAPRREGYLSDALHRRAVQMFERRTDDIEARHKALTSHYARKNRIAALQPPVHGANGELLYFTKCACKWHGLRVSDPEVARREYDDHACSLVDADGQWQPGQTGRRNENNAWSKPGWAAETKAQLSAQAVPVHVEDDDAPVVVTTEVDGTEQRMKLLELK